MRLMDTVGAAQTGALTGDHWTVHHTQDDHSRVFAFELVSGTCTWIFEGRIGDDHSWVTLDNGTGSAQDGNISAWPQVRLRLSAATAAVVIADFDAVGRVI